MERTSPELASDATVVASIGAVCGHARMSPMHATRSPVCADTSRTVRSPASARSNDPGDPERRSCSSALGPRNGISKSRAPDSMHPRAFIGLASAPPSVQTITRLIPACAHIPITCTRLGCANGSNPPKRTPRGGPLELLGLIELRKLRMSAAMRSSPAGDLARDVHLTQWQTPPWPSEIGLKASTDSHPREEIESRNPLNSSNSSTQGAGPMNVAAPREPLRSKSVVSEEGFEPSRPSGH